MKKQQNLLFSFAFCACVSDCTRRNTVKGWRWDIQAIAYLLCRKTSLRKYYQTKTHHTGHISPFKGREQCRLTTKTRVQSFYKAGAAYYWQIIQLNSKWVSLKPCSTESTGFRTILVVNSLFYRECKLSSSTHSFFGRGSSCASDCVSIHEAFIFRLSSWAVISQNSGTHWYYAREEGGKLHSDHSRLHWAGWV